MPDEFSLDQIKAAFWMVFHGSGELWFPYPATGEGSVMNAGFPTQPARSTEAECTKVSEDYWKEFVQALSEVKAKTDAR